MDIVSKKKRSLMMSNIKSHNTKPEISLRSHLHRLGYRFRLKQKISGTKPDLLITKYQTCIFVHGCYWHRHKNCKLASKPKSNKAFWEAKFASNVLRDQRNIDNLLLEGWRVGIVWECSIRSEKFKNFNYANAFFHLGFWQVE